MIDPTTNWSVLSLGKLRMREPWRIEMLHSQSRHRLYWINRGQGRVTINCVTRGFGPHTALYVPAGAQLALELPSQMQGLELCLPPNAALHLPETPWFLRVTQIEAQASLTGHLERIERELAARAPAMDRAMTGYGLLVSAWMERELTRAEGAVLRDKAHHLAERFATLMEHRFRSGQGVADYATDLSVTPTHLSRICKDSAGRPAHALLVERIMHEARRLLRDTDMPAREVAQTLGFSSAAYFTRAFQQASGRTPTEFRAPALRA